MEKDDENEQNKRGHVKNQEDDKTHIYKIML
jgi:hypothetical protein